MSSHPASPRFEVLDSWRGICALLVALLHFQANSHLSKFAFFQNAYLFVDFFFVLSGFVIAANYGSRLAEGFGLGRFMLLRFGRLYPLYFVTFMAFVGFEILQLIVPQLGAMGSSTPFAAPKQSLDTVVANIFLLQSFGTYDFLTWNTPGWSIATEFWTYLVFAIVACFLPQFRSLVMVAFVVGGLGLLLTFSAHGMNTTYDLGMIRCVSGFSAGVVAYDIWTNRLADLKLHRKLGTILEILVIAATITFVAAAGQGAMSIFAPVVFGMVVLVFAAEGGTVSCWLRRPAMLLLGALSYSIYMVHLFIETQLLNVGKLMQAKFGIPLISLGQHNGEPVKLLGLTEWQGDIWIAVLVCVLLGVSALSYRLVEVPSREWFRKLASGKLKGKATARTQTVQPAMRPTY